MHIWNWLSEFVARMPDEEKRKEKVAEEVYSENKLRESIKLFTVNARHDKANIPA